MGKETGIEWTDHTFNPWWGCSRVSPGCDHCYAETLAKRFGLGWGRESPRRFFGESHWREPLNWHRAAVAEMRRRRVFCASMADVFENQPDLQRERARLLALIDDTPSLEWLLLTKRPHLIEAMYRRPRVAPNVSLGTSVESPAEAYRIDQLRRAGERRGGLLFLSLEPLLGPVDLRGHLGRDRVSWVIVGGESGGGAREVNADWVRSLRDQCGEAGVAFFFKQWGDVRDGVRVGKRKLGAELDGRRWQQFPVAHGIPSLLQGRDP